MLRWIDHERPHRRPVSACVALKLINTTYIPDEVYGPELSSDSQIDSNTCLFWVLSFHHSLQDFYKIADHPVAVHARLRVER